MTRADTALRLGPGLVVDRTLPVVWQVGAVESSLPAVQARLRAALEAVGNLRRDVVGSVVAVAVAVVVAIAVAVAVTEGDEGQLHPFPSSVTKGSRRRRISLLEGGTC